MQIERQLAGRSAEIIPVAAPAEAADRVEETCSAGIVALAYEQAASKGRHRPDRRRRRQGRTIWHLLPTSRCVALVYCTAVGVVQRAGIDVNAAPNTSKHCQYGNCPGIGVAKAIGCELFPPRPIIAAAPNLGTCARNSRAPRVLPRCSDEHLAGRPPPRQNDLMNMAASPADLVSDLLPSPADIRPRRPPYPPTDGEEEIGLHR